MPRQKKDGKYINLRIERIIAERLDEYAKIKGQTKTVALERILGPYLEDFFKDYPGKDPKNM